MTKKIPADQAMKNRIRGDLFGRVMKTGSAGIFLELETEVSLSLVDIFNIFGCLFADCFIWNGF